MGTIATCQYIWSALNKLLPRKFPGVPPNDSFYFTPPEYTGLNPQGNQNRIANCRFLLRQIDIANNGTTSYATNFYATDQVVDTVAVDDAIARLVPIVVEDFLLSSVTAYIDGNDRPDYTLPHQYGTSINRTVNFTQNTHVFSVTSPERLQYFHKVDIGWIGLIESHTYSDSAELPRYIDMLISSNGIDWTRHRISSFTSRWPPSGSSSTLSSITCGNGVFIIGGYNGYRRSTDGINWTQHNLIAPGRTYSTWNRVVHNGSAFVMSSYNNSAPATEDYYRSTNGSSWTQTNAPVTLGTGSSGRLYVAGGMFFAHVANNLYYSTNGSTWNVHNLTRRNTLGFGAILYANGVWITSGGYLLPDPNPNLISEPRIFRSINSWSSYTMLTLPFAGFILVGVLNDKFYGRAGGRLYSSSNGTTWELA